MISDSKLVKQLDEWLSIEEIEDDSLNGVQVDAGAEIEKISFAVDARIDTIKETVKSGSDLLIVHHGMIWGGGLGRLAGDTYRKVKILMKNDVGLYAAHLPLDIHPQIGNNVQLAELLGAEPSGRFLEYKGRDIALLAEFDQGMELDEIEFKISKKLDIEPFVLDPRNSKEDIEKIGILTGKGGKALSEAYELGADLFVTGERSYMTHNEAIDIGMPIIFAGHYATETLGVKKLMDVIEDEFDHDCEFIETKTPV